MTIEGLYIKINSIINGIYWTNYLGLARSLLAIGTLLTLLANDNNVLFSFGVQNENAIRCTGLNTLSIYCLLNNLLIAKCLSVFILLFVFIGIYPRITAIFHWWVTYSFATSSYVIDGGDQIAMILTLFLIPICLFDRRKWHWQRDVSNHSFYEKSIAFIFYLLITIQIVVIYFHAAVGKLEVTEWVNGTAIYYWFINPIFGMNNYISPFLIPVLGSPILLTFATWGVLLFELFLASCIFIQNKVIRYSALFSGILFHFFIMIIHGLVSFFFTMSAALILYLIAKKKHYVTISR